MVAQAGTSQGLAPVEPPPTLRATHLWLFGTELSLDDGAPVDDRRGLMLAAVAAGCAAVDDIDGYPAAGLGDAVEGAFTALAIELGVATEPLVRTANRRAEFPAGALSRRVTGVDDGRHGVTVTVKGAVGAVLPYCTLFLDDEGRAVPLTREARLRLRRAVARHVGQGRQVVAVAHRAVGVGRPAPIDRPDAETDLVLIGLAAMTTSYGAGLAASSGGWRR
jgi:magnesium-transporting ATPase (P-type)